MRLSDIFVFINVETFCKHESIYVVSHHCCWCKWSEWSGTGRWSLFFFSFNLIHARWLQWSMSPACSRFLVRCVQYYEHQLLFMCPAARERRLCARLWLQCCVVLGANWRSWRRHCWYWWWCFSGSRRHLGTRDSVHSKSVFSRYHLICFGCFLFTEFLTGFLSLVSLVFAVQTGQVYLSGGTNRLQH